MVSLRLAPSSFRRGNSHWLYHSGAFDKSVHGPSIGLNFILIAFFIQFNVPFKIISLIEKSQSIGWGKREYPWKTTWHTRKQNLSCLTCGQCGARTYTRHSAGKQKIHDIQDLTKSRRLVLRSSPGTSIEDDAPLTLGWDYSRMLHWSAMLSVMRKNT